MAEYHADRRLITWIKNNMGGCPQTPGDLLKIRELDSGRVNRSTSTDGYLTPKWLVETEGDFTLIGEMKSLRTLRLDRLELRDWSFLARCRGLQKLDLAGTNFSDCRILAELPELVKVRLPVPRTLKHTEVLDAIQAGVTASGVSFPEVQEEVPFYRDEDYGDLQEVDGGDIHVAWRDSVGVRCVFVRFAGKAPASWRDFPHSEDQEDNWRKLAPEAQKELAAQLAESIRRGRVEEFALSLEPWGEGHSLCGDFAPGWAALWLDDMEDTGQSYVSYNPDYDTVEVLCPVEVGGQSPVPKMWALEDMEEAARIAEHFLLTARLPEGSRWLLDETET